MLCELRKKILFNGNLKCKTLREVFISHSAGSPVASNVIWPILFNFFMVWTLSTA